MAEDTVTIPKALADQVVAALWCANEMAITLEHMGADRPSDEAMLAVNCILRGLSRELDHALGFLPTEFPKALEAGSEVAHG